MNDLVLLTNDGPLSTITLNRPERHNSLTIALLGELLQALEALPETSQVLLRRANGRSFSTGGDSRGFYEHFDDLEEYTNSLVSLLNQVLLALLDLPVPLVTAVHGIVTGGSLGLILASDIVLVTPEASFTPYYNVIGFSPDGGWSGWLAAIIGPGRSAEALLCNRTISAQEAVKWGLTARLVDAQNIQTESMQTARLIATMKRGSMRHTRELLQGGRSDIVHSLEQERVHFIGQIGTAKARQGILDFLAASGAAT